MLLMLEKFHPAITTTRIILKWMKCLRPCVYGLVLHTSQQCADMINPATNYTRLSYADVRAFFLDDGVVSSEAT